MVSGWGVAVAVGVGVALGVREAVGVAVAVGAGVSVGGSVVVAEGATTSATGSGRGKFPQATSDKVNASPTTHQRITLVVFIRWFQAMLTDIQDEVERARLAFAHVLHVHQQFRPVNAVGVIPRLAGEIQLCRQDRLVGRLDFDVEMACPPGV